MQQNGNKIKDYKTFVKPALYGVIWLIVMTWFFFD